MKTNKIIVLIFPLIIILSLLIPTSVLGISIPEIEETIDLLLRNALDTGIRELDFWEMTPGEVVRAIESGNRVRRLEAQEKASYDYILATLIVKGVSITLGDKSAFPSIQQAYPGIFDEVIAEQEEAMEKRKTELSVLRFKQFAQSYNSNLKSKEVPQNK